MLPEIFQTASCHKNQLQRSLCLENVDGSYVAWISGVSVGFFARRAIDFHKWLTGTVMLRKESKTTRSEIPLQLMQTTYQNPRGSFDYLILNISVFGSLL